VWVDDIKACLKEQVCGSVEWMQLVWRSYLKVYMNMAIKLWVPQKERNIPEQLAQLWFLQGGVSKRNVHRNISCGQLPLSAADILQNVTQSLVFVQFISFCIKFILLASVTY
jgi:hypothetical protein